MKNAILAIFTAVCLSLTAGCGNLSPRLDPKLDQQLDNTNGKIDEIKNNQNGVMAEIGTLKQQAEIQNSKLDRVQHGLANFQQNYDNHGVQILSGNGGLIVGLTAILCLCIVIMHYRREARLQAKTAEMMAQRISEMDDPDLTEAVYSAAMYTDCEANVLKIMKKHQR